MSASLETHRQQLVDAARAAFDRAHAPYSHFHVGAALLCEDGTVVAGCNVENATYGATVCAERNAVGTAIHAGHTRFVACVVYVDTDRPVAPCGICRQVLAEFAGDIPVLCVTKQGAERTFSLDELLPERFELLET